MINQIKTIILLATLSAILIVVGRLVGGTYGMTIALVIAIAMNFFSYFFSDKIVLSMYGAREVSKEEFPRLHELVEDVARNAHLPKPRIYIIEQDSPNAFATGRDPNHSAIAFTRGIIKILDERELKGVIAHEMSHIKNSDILISTVSSVIATAITYLIQILQFSFFFRNSDERERNPIADLLVIILAPIAALIIQMAISRSREFLADETGAKIIRDPMSLANALKKIDYYAHQIPISANPSTAHLFILGTDFEGFLNNLFSTHPSTEERIKRLTEMARKLGMGY